MNSQSNRTTSSRPQGCSESMLPHDEKIKITKRHETSIKIPSTKYKDGGLSLNRVIAFEGNQATVHHTIKESGQRFPLLRPHCFIFVSVNTLPTNYSNKEIKNNTILIY